MGAATGRRAALSAAAADAIDVLRAAGQTVGTAESLTGGLVAATLAGVPGSSKALLGGVVAYATEVKTAVLGVDPEVVSTYGVISQECALAMASSARRLLGADWAVATTGVAGPERQEGQPVGTVHVAVAGPEGAAHRQLALSGERNEIRLDTVQAVLVLLIEAVSPGGYPGRV